MNSNVQLEPLNHLVFGLRVDLCDLRRRIRRNKNQVHQLKTGLASSSSSSLFSLPLLLFTSSNAGILLRIENQREDMYFENQRLSCNMFIILLSLSHCYKRTCLHPVIFRVVQNAMKNEFSSPLREENDSIFHWWSSLHGLQPIPLLQMTSSLQGRQRSNFISGEITQESSALHTCP